MRQLIHVTSRSAVLPVLLVVMCSACGCFAASLTCSCFSDKVRRADRAKSIPAVVRDVPFGSEGASQTCTVIGRNDGRPPASMCRQGTWMAPGSIAAQSGIAQWIHWWQLRV
ncbi:surface protease GP63 [Trypanosoma cruzi]|nr:surface protease GP63 [Trypanosoma cruzi]